MARRSKEDAGERHTGFVGVHLTPSQHAELERRAALAGLSMSAFARFVLLSDLKAPAPPTRDPQALRALTVEIIRVGVNVNQMAKMANETRAVPHERHLLEVAAQIKATLEKVIAA
jgi:Bacterial mobilisation protein (MobC)